LSLLASCRPQIRHGGAAFYNVCAVTEQLITVGLLICPLFVVQCAGLDLIWRIYLGSADDNVADLLKRNLLTLYHGNNIHVTKETPHIRSALVE
jgi:hypothetical protein